MKRIVVGVDGSAESEKALRLAAELARPLGAELLVTYVIPPTVPPAETYILVMADIEAAGLRHGESVVARCEKALEGRGVALRTQIRSGDPASALAELAEQEQADLVVVGSRGLGAVKRMLLGSTSNRLVHVSQRPVLVVP
ncbi:MAG: universal stress protein [Myxococcales bacterium]